MEPVLTLSREQIRAVDRCAIDALGVPGVVLMENAARNAADAIAEFVGLVEGHAIAIVAGAGNNGGDGFVIARHLAMRGAKVATFLVVAPDKLTGDARTNLQIIRKLRCDIRELKPDEIAKLSEQLQRFDLIVDAIGGTGITGALRGNLALAVEQINATAKPVVAVDIPTGLDCDEGTASGPVVRAALTVTMLARKKGFDAPGADQYTGEVRVVDIGIPAHQVAQIALGS